MPKIQRALLSVSDKSGLAEFAAALAKAGIELISTGGTARSLREAGLTVIDLSDFTGFPEMLDGRVKTLHPKVHGGLLYLRENPEHQSAAASHGIVAIDLVVVNLYPFEATVAKTGVSFHEAIENIDIGGPSMLRSAAKNHESVTVVTDPADYPEVARQITESGDTDPAFRRKLAAKVYARTAVYDVAIASYLRREVEGPSQLPPSLLITAPRVQSLRYGENPHQQAALYGEFNQYFDQLHGKELSYNNILDLTAAAALIEEFEQEGDAPAVAILKHTNPCGVAQGPDLRAAWENAFATDRQAPFGGIIAVNRPLDLSCAEAISEIFSEVVVAPDFTQGAVEVLQKKKNLRLLRRKKPLKKSGGMDLRSVGAGSFLLQERDLRTTGPADLKCVTRRPPTPAELNAMLFGWKVVKHVKSNAIVYASADSSGHGRTLGIGAGQMSRVDSSRIAVWKAGEAGLSLAGSVVCSDAFFPFADGLIAAAGAGATAAVQPGGSVRDAEVIQAADGRNMAMLFTGTRHFRH